MWWFFQCLTFDYLIYPKKNHLKASFNVPFFPYHVDNCSTLDLEPASSSDRVLRNYEYQCHLFSIADLNLQLDIGRGWDAGCVAISASRTAIFIRFVFKSPKTFIRVWWSDDGQDDGVSFCHDAGHEKTEESDSDRDQGVGQGHLSEWQVSS